MNNCGFSGKIYKLEDNKKSGKDANVRFRLAVRKPFVSDADKQANKYNHFVSVNGWGARAEQLAQHFKDGDFIEVTCNWDPFEGTDGKDVPQFRLVDWSFPAGGSANSGGNSGGNSDAGEERGSRGNNRDAGRDSGREERSSGRRGATATEDETEAPPRRGSRRGSEEGATDNTPF